MSTYSKLFKPLSSWLSTYHLSHIGCCYQQQLKNCLPCIERCYWQSKRFLSGSKMHTKKPENRQERSVMPRITNDSRRPQAISSRTVGIASCNRESPLLSSNGSCASPSQTVSEYRCWVIELTWNCVDIRRQGRGWSNINAAEGQPVFWTSISCETPLPTIDLDWQQTPSEAILCYDLRYGYYSEAHFKAIGRDDYTLAEVERLSSSLIQLALGTQA